MRHCMGFCALIVGLYFSAPSSLVSLDALFATGLYYHPVTQIEAVIDRAYLTKICFGHVIPQSRELPPKLVRSLVYLQPTESR